MCSQSLVVSSHRLLLVRCFAIIDIYKVILILALLILLLCSLLLTVSFNHGLLMPRPLVRQLRLINRTLSMADDF